MKDIQRSREWLHLRIVLFCQAVGSDTTILLSKVGPR
jgi:hypothetical protein